MSVDRLSPARAEDILGQVRRQIRREVLFPIRHTAVRLYTGVPRVWNSGVAKRSQQSSSEELAERLEGLFSSLDVGFAASAREIGEMPAPAPTLRGTVGRFAITVLQKLLWWYTRSLKQLAESTGNHLQASTEAIELLACMTEANRREIAALREEIRGLREAQQLKTEMFD